MTTYYWFSKFSDYGQDCEYNIDSNFLIKSSESFYFGFQFSSPSFL